jgi:hypothetical protein
MPFPSIRQGDITSWAAGNGKFKEPNNCKVRPAPFQPVVSLEAIRSFHAQTKQDAPQPTGIVLIAKGIDESLVSKAIEKRAGVQERIGRAFRAHYDGMKLASGLREWYLARNLPWAAE